MKTIQENNATLNAQQERVWQDFYSKCADEWQLSDSSIARLLGVSRQTIVNYKTPGKRAPCLGAVMRIKMVLPLLVKAAGNGILPAPSKWRQVGLVEKILGQ